jgi:hypothetical protein
MNAGDRRGRGLVDVDLKYRLTLVRLAAVFARGVAAQSWKYNESASAQRRQN